MGNIFFKFGSWELTPDSETGLNALVKLLNDNPNITIEMAAHTDLVGNNTDNQALSLRRAQSVVDYLIQHGIEQERLTPVGYGEEKPVVVDDLLHKQYPFLPKDQVLDEASITTLTNDQQEVCNSLNRRTEFRVLKTTYNLY
jgi:peptidoglycan-associated lipoprotein